MMTIILGLLLVIVVLAVLMLVVSFLAAILKPHKTTEQRESLTQEDEDLEFITALITFDFFFFDW
jgi:flagellar basal body-associated protein FliL